MTDFVAYFALVAAIAALAGILYMASRWHETRAARKEWLRFNFNIGPKGPKRTEAGVAPLFASFSLIGLFVLWVLLPGILQSLSILLGESGS